MGVTARAMWKRSAATLENCDAKGGFDVHISTTQHPTDHRSCADPSAELVKGQFIFIFIFIYIHLYFYIYN